MKRYNVYLPIPMLAQISELSKETGFSASELVRQALAAFISTKKGQK